MAKPEHNNSLLYIRFTGCSIQGDQEAFIDNKSEKNLIPVKSYSFAMAMAPAGVGIGSAQDNTNKRYGCIRVFVPIGYYNQFTDVVFVGNKVGSVEILTTSVINNLAVRTLSIEAKTCFVNGMKSFNGAQFDAISSEAPKYMMQEFFALEMLSSKQKIFLEWFDDKLFINTSMGHRQPSIDEACMIYIIYTNMTMKASVVVRNNVEGNVAAEISRT